MSFVSSTFFPDSLLHALIDARVQRPSLVLEQAERRVRRKTLTLDGRLNIIAADHPARYVSNVGANLLGMADRRDYLARILRVLVSEGVDGVMASMDILEDLLLVDALRREADLDTLLDNKLLIASFNRGGLAGAAWELDDPMTGPDANVCQQFHLDGAKTLLRLDLNELGSLKTIVACAEAITHCNTLELPMFLEPLPVARTDKGYPVTKTPEAVARLAGVASALGDSSRYLWLKLPYTEDFATVARSTTLPIVLLGGESAGNPLPFLEQLSTAMRSGYNVRGAMVGRNVLFPGEGDPAVIARAAGAIIHGGLDAAAAFAQFDAPLAAVSLLYPGGPQ
jgi:DhnA family fructose-bisphosphate aldolase class Ia